MVKVSSKMSQTRLNDYNINIIDKDEDCGTENRDNILMNKFVERYKIHQYWSRKPWYVVRQYLEQYSSPGDVVLDPFVGSGVTAFEALAIGRHAIARDINPTSILLTKVLCAKNIDLSRLERQLIDILEHVPRNINDLYITECRSCHKEIEFINAIWDKEVLSKLFINCPYCGFKGVVDPLPIDIKKLDEVNKIPFNHWYPKDVRLPKDADVEYVHELYTIRNLLTLSVLNHLIESITDEKYREIFKLMLISTSTRTIKSIFINKYRLSRNINPAGVWGEKRFWVPDTNIENNALFYFKERYDKVRKAKTETNYLLNCSMEDPDLGIGDAQDLEDIKDKSVDYVFTDPPYAGTVKYLDLSIVWNSWQNCVPDVKNEIILGNGNSAKSYYHKMHRALDEIFRVLKDDKYLSICLHFSNFSTWRDMLLLIKAFNYQFHDIAIIEPLKKSHNQLTMKGTVESDVILTIQKKRLEYDVKSGGLEVVLKLSDIIDNYIATNKSDRLLKTFEIYDDIIKHMAFLIFEKNMQIDIDIQNIKILEEHLECIGVEKIVDTETDYQGKKRDVIKWNLNNV